MKVVFDSNIVLDAYMKRDPFNENSAAVLKLSEFGGVDGRITANSVTDIYYVLKRYLNDEDKAIESLKKLISTVSVADILSSDVDTAFDLGFSDFEDALLSSCAVRIGSDFIITRNIKDFEKSPVAPITPTNFLKLYKESE
ncbi:MAG: PIN domain-containing protein [Clostridiales Family XIII bacterium]|jgi:predicted nucleic acid-binding protein|nr:PIN domain-containing protein [Clostridiales Family XIII bacterium]